MTQVFLLYTNGTVSTWADPGNWNASANFVECIGSGGAGSHGDSSDINGGGGGGGGAYAHGTNLSPTFPVSYCCGTYSTANGAAGVNALGTNFNYADGNVHTSGPGVSAACAQLGQMPTAGGGNAGTSVWPAGFAGGNGGFSSLYYAAGGGGGAGGPHGAGGAGTAPVSNATGGVGGSADGGWVAGGATGSPGGAGGNGLWWDTSHGLGGGGGGGTTTNAAGGAGGNFGGGGGGGGQPTGAGGTQGSSLIVVTYLPKGYKQVFLMAGTTSFPDPGDWNPNANTVEIVGCGSQGWSHLVGGPPTHQSVAGIGGGGGGYGKGTNRNDPFPVALALPPNNAFFTTPPYYANWGDPNGGNAVNGNLNQGLVYAGVACAQGSILAELSYGGVAGGPTAGYAGGNGGGTGAGYTYGAGGGGAGGPHGAGSVGGNASTTVVGAGGAADGGCVIGTPQSPANVGFVGFAFNPWSATPYGVGGGGAGGGTGQTEGGAARGYGGGGGGGPSTGTAQALGGDSICVVTYLPATPANAFAMILAE